MRGNRDDFTDKTIELLARRAGWRCSNPFCRALTCSAADAVDAAMNVGVAAHICAAAPKGKRYDPEMTREARRHISNGIWLCQTCSRLIDCDAQRYTVQLLHDWKDRAERETILELERGRNKAREPEIPFPERIRGLAEAVRSCHSYEAAMGCLGTLQTEMDTLVERMEGLRDKVELAKRNGDMQWERIYQTQFGHTLSLFEQLSSEARNMQQRVYALRSDAEDLTRSAPAGGLEAVFVIDVSGSMGGTGIAPTVVSHAQKLLQWLYDGWQRMAVLEEELDKMFNMIHPIELLNLELDEALAASDMKNKKI